MNFYKHFIGDYQRDTMHLTMMQDGAYRRLLDACYATERVLPADTDACYRLARAFSKDEREATDAILREFFPVGLDGFRHNKRTEKELANATAYADAQSMRAHKRWQMQADMPEKSPEDASHSQTPKPEPDTKAKKSKAARVSRLQTEMKMLTDLGVSEQHAQDWLLVRKAKDAPLTPTAVKRLQVEAEKAGIAVDEAVAVCAERSWQSFNASWNWKGESNGNGRGEVSGKPESERAAARRAIFQPPGVAERDVTGDSQRVD